MPDITSESEAQQYLDGAKAVISASLDSARACLTDARRVMGEISTLGFGEGGVRKNQIDSSLDCVGRKLEEVLTTARMLLEKGIIDKPQADQVVASRVPLIQQISDISAQVANKYRMSQYSGFDQLMMSVVTATGAVEVVRGVTAALYNVWVKYVKPIVEGLEKTAQGTGMLLAILPWAAAGIGGYIVLKKAQVI